MEHRINRIHERTLTIIYSYKNQLTFKEILAKNKAIKIHQRNLQILATEICKAKTKTFSDIVNSLLELNNKH